MIEAKTQPLEAKYHRLEMSFRIIAGIALIAIVALIGVVVWTLARSGSSGAPSEMANSVAAVWTQHDTDLVEDVYALDAVVVDAWGYRTSGRDDIAGAAEAAGIIDMSVTVEGTPVGSDRTIVYPAIVSLGAVGAVPREASVLTRLTLDEDGLVARHEDFLLVPEPAEIAGSVADAWSAHDAGAAAALYAEDAVHIDDQGYVTSGREAIADYIDLGAVVSFAVTVDGPERQAGEIVFFESTQTADVGGEIGREIVHVLTMLELDEDGLIARQQDFVAPPRPED